MRNSRLHLNSAEVEKKEMKLRFHITKDPGTASSCGEKQESKLKAILVADAVKLIHVESVVCCLQVRCCVLAAWRKQLAYDKHMIKSAPGYWFMQPYLT